MEKKLFPKRTKVLFLIFGIVAVMAIIFGVWNSWRLKSSAFGWPGLPGGHTSGMLIAQAKDASNGNALLNGVSVSGQGYQCTTGANGTGRCYLGTVNIGSVSATFSKTGYQSKTVSRNCGFGMATTCTIEASLSKGSTPAPSPSVTANNFTGYLWVVINGVSTKACMGPVLGPPENRTGGCTVNLTMTPSGSKTWEHVGGAQGGIASVGEYLTPGSYQITGGNILSADQQHNYNLANVNGSPLPYSFKAGAGANMPIQLNFR